MQNQTDKLSAFGEKFQLKTISAIMVDKEFLDQIFDIFDPQFYDSEAVQWIAEKTMEYYHEYAQSPTLDYFKTEVVGIDDESFKASIVNKLKKVWAFREETDLGYVKNKFIEFAKNQKVKLAVLESIDLLRQGDYDGIRETVDEALKAGMDKSIGHLYFDDLEARFEEGSRDTIPTPWDVVNEDLDGGLAKGEIGTLVATSGAGKTWFLCALAAEALRLGKRVVYYTLELNERQISLRLDSIFSGLSPTDVTDSKEYVRNLVADIKERGGDLVTQQYPMDSVSALTLSAHMDRMKIVRGDIDLVLVDYGDLMKSAAAHDGSSYQAQGNIYGELRKMAVEQDVPVWTVSQSQRSAIRSNVVEADQVADSYKKIMVSDIVLSLSRKRVDKIAKTGRFHMMKNRVGNDGQIYPSTFDPSCGKIEIYNQDSVRGRELMLKMADDEKEVERKSLAQKYDQFKSAKTSSSTW